MNRGKQFAILLLTLLNFSCSSLAKPTEVVYLIPEGFTGGVIIVFNQPDGITPETTADGTIIYRIPKGGLIKVKEPLKKATYTFSYYFVDEKGNKTSIEYLYPRYYVRNPGDTTTKSFDTISEDETNNKIFAMNHTTSYFDASGEKAYLYSFIVEKPAAALQAQLQTQDKIFNIQKELSRKSNPVPEKQSSKNE